MGPVLSTGVPQLTPARRPPPWPPGTWRTLEEVVDELNTTGGDGPAATTIPVLNTDEKEIHELGDGRVAWFSDPDGNTFAIEEGSVR